ncbi:LysR family transcriptional regulator [Sulfuritalea sp.]|uniref:LysR family transcriptional regulator n=1 Tax=Sulfuritalea sp. TaxID=2480090 RepID=UPI001ACD2418|nr:LysR family transcriptional regulator [Sulfuritalea sp.]MBN8477255.1 LysR family transcriptional regulator [Sulfuritalea sp.]
MNIKNFDLNLLVVFDAVLGEGSISRAAARLDLSQPAVSNALARLRKATGDRLFVRLGNGVAPTPYAASIAEPIRAALAAIGASLAGRQEFDAATSQRDFAIHITDLGEAFFLPRLLARLNRSAPRVRLRNLALSTDEAREALRSGAADLTIGNLPDFEAGFYQQRLFRDRYVCILSRDHPTIGARLTARQFAAASHAIAMPGGTGHGIIERTLVDHGLESRIALRVQNFLVLPSIVAASDLIAIVPHSVGSQISPRDAVKLLPLPVDIPAFDIRQCWHERYHDDPGHRWLRQQFMELFSA